MLEIKLEKIKPNHLNPRTTFTKEGLDALSQSIKTYGLLEPIMVRKIDDYYEVVIGERRYRASQQTGLKTIPCIVKDLTDDEVIEYNLVENVMREDLTEVEKGRCCKRLLKEYPDKYSNLVRLSVQIGVKKQTINTWMQTAEAVTPEIEKYIAPSNPDTKRVPEGKVRSYDVYEITRKVKEPKRQLKIVEKIAEKRLPINDLREVTKKVAQEPEKPVEQIFKEFEEKPAEIPFRYNHMKSIMDGVKIQTSRKGLDPKIKEGSKIIANLWQPSFAELKVKKIEKKNLHDFTEEDAQREGGYTLEEFKQVWIELHGKWNPNDSVNIIHFEMINKPLIEVT